MRWRISLGLLALALLAAPAAAQTTLRYKFKEGEKLDYVMDQDMKMSMNVGGMDVEMKMTNSVEMAWHIKKVDSDGNAQVELKMGRVKMSMMGPTGNVEVDSTDKKEANDPVGQIFGQIVQAMSKMDMSFTISPTGDIKDAKVSEEAVKALQGLPGADKLGGDMFGPDSIKRMVQGGMALPKDPVKKGDTWSQKADMKLPFGKTTGEVKYTYEGTAEKDGRTVQKIAVKPALKIEPDPDAPLQIAVKSQEGKGHTYFDNEAGKVLSTTTEQTMEMTVEVGGMTITQRVVQNTTMKLKGAGGAGAKKATK